MRFTISVIALLFALMFGAMTVLDGMTVARAGEGDDDAQTLAPTSGSGCLNDDGDDDEEPNEEPVDDPDSEDGEDEENLPGSEDGDAEEDGDPPIEEDDCPTPLPYGFCGDMTAPGVYLFTEANYLGACIHFNNDVNWINSWTCDSYPVMCWNDITSSAKLVNIPQGVSFCLHSYYDGNCELVMGDVPNFNTLFNEQCGDPPPICGMDNNMSSFYYGAVEPVAVPDDTVVPEGQTFEAADADCDGGVGVSDALTNLQYLSGFEVGCAGEWDGDSYGGDADCSGDVAAGDVMAILAAVASGSEAAC